MRALHCDYGKRADFLRDVEETLGGKEEKEEWDRLVNDNPCPDDNWSCLNDIIGRIAKQTFWQKDTRVWAHRNWEISSGVEGRQGKESTNSFAVGFLASRLHHRSL